MTKITVCQGCEERYTACHDHCDKYQAAKRKVAEDKQMVEEKRKDEFLYADYKRHRKKKRAQR